MPEQQEQIVLKPQSAGFEAGCLILSFIMLCISIYVVSLQLGYYLTVDDVDAIKNNERPADVKTEPVFRELDKIEELRTAASQSK